MNNCVGIMGSYLRSLESQGLIVGQFKQYENVSVVRDDLGIVAQKVEDFLRDVV